MRDFGFQWHLTDRCNLRCVHCYQDDFSPHRELPLDALNRMLDKIFSAMPDRKLSVNLTGGEPFLFSGLLDVIERLHQYASLDEINLITNGTIATADLLESIGRHPKVQYLKISIESADRDINDRIRGAGNFERVRRNLPALRERTGRPLILMMTMARYNIDSLRQTVEFARNEGFSGVIFERFVPLGTGGELAAEVLTRSDWQRATETLIELSGLEADPLDLLPYRAYWLWTDVEHEAALAGASCNLGAGSMALMPNGDVYPCRRFPRPVGNLISQPFEEILDKLATFAPAKLRPLLTDPLCAGCDDHDCVGCRALALALTGQIGADDRQCILGCDSIRTTAG